MYQSGRLPPKKHRALPWGLSTTVACTRVVDYHPKNTVHYTLVSENRGKCYQPQKSLPKRALKNIKLQREHDEHAYIRCWMSYMEVGWDMDVIDGGGSR